MLVAIYPLASAVVGLLILSLATSADLKRVGHHVFWTSYLVLMLVLAQKTFRIG